ncbi:hypothetical protein QR98_0087820 [Sarcoptes scabiei]|uniref:C2H2-type domain-containing protein n=1 Tax=Sarcoptes scabiei TaxID=52283 RepID=A0A132AGW1_SARSC|nr:hypothetical protein QR98_0087820 [Sarcoptes scabiei]
MKRTSLMNGINFTPPTTPFQVETSNLFHHHLDIHSCMDCGKSYSTASNLTRHRQTHRSVDDKKARKCPHCSKIYPFICGRCGKAFALKSYLYKHEESSCMKLSQETIKSSKRNDSRKRSKRFDSIVDDEMKSIQNL